MDEPSDELKSLAGQSEGAAWEALSVLKRRSQSRLKHWEGLVEQKEKALEGSRLRAAALEAELGALRRDMEERRSEEISEAVGRQAQMEAALKALSDERARHEEETRSLKALLDDARRRLAEAGSRRRLEEEEWLKREQASLLDLKELEGLAERRRGELAQTSQESRRLAQGLDESKKALEKTLAELLEERRIRREAEEERAQAVKKVEEIQGHLANLEKIWDEERAQWKELWERERAGWENQKAEFSAWEQKQRRERETWQAELRVKEETELKFASDLARTLRDSAEASSKIGALLRRLGVADIPSSPREGARRLWKALKPVLAAAAVAGAAYGAFLYMTALRFKPVQTVPVSWPDPTALAYDGTSLWAAQWDGRLIAVDPARPAQEIEAVSVAVPPPYHPAALAFGGDVLWTLDAAQARLLRQDAKDPARVLAAFPAPGAAPTALAFDGKSLWSYDAAAKALDRHGSPETSVESYALPSDAALSAMAWAGRDLWVFDSKTRALLIFAFKNGAFALKSRHPFNENVVGLAPVPAPAGKAGRSLWVLAAPGPSRATSALIRYAY